MYHKNLNKMKKSLAGILTVFALILFLSSCSQAQKNKNKPYVPTNTQELDGLSKAYFASGCFWCVEAIYESVNGVKEVISGYAGGKSTNPTYYEVGSGMTGHAEAVAVYYDPKLVDFQTLVKVFYGSQDPTTVGQKPDFGNQYRSIIFYSNEQEKAIAEAAKKEVAESGMYDKPVVTEILPFEKFYNAEAYHQNYEKLHPDEQYVKYVSIPRLKRFQEKFPEILKPMHE